jgi:hypothetical protein
MPRAHRLWSGLPAVELEIELAKLGLTLDDLVQDAEDDPGAAPVMEKLKSNEAKRRFAVEWFGDQGHPQPKERQRRVIAYFGPDSIVYANPTPDWERLPRLEDEESSLKSRSTTEELDLGGNGYTRQEIRVAVELLNDRQLTARRLEREARCPSRERGVSGSGLTPAPPAGQRVAGSRSTAGRDSNGSVVRLPRASA